MEYNKEYLLSVLEKFETKFNKLPTRREMRKAFGITEEPFMRVFGSWNEAKSTYKASKVAEQDIFELNTTFDEDLLYGDIVKAEQAQEGISRIFDSWSDFKILSLSDIELPYANTDMLNDAVAFAIEQGVSVCVLNGDVTHGDFFSKHAKTAYISPEEEFAQLEQLCAWLSKKFEYVVLVSGNHDRMGRKFCQRAIPQYESMQFLVKDDLLAIMSDKYSNVIYANNWWVKIKDVVFMHPDSFTILPMRTAIGAAKQIAKHGITASAYVQGHTHKVGCYRENSVTYYETGCCCRPQVYYMHRGSIMWDTAFNIIDITHGSFNFNNSRNYTWNEE